jgi:HSP20 family molecular chaperone IbpA
MSNFLDKIYGNSTDPVSLINRFFERPSFNFNGSSLFDFPKFTSFASVKNNEKATEFAFEVPGATKENIDISVDEKTRVLTVNAKYNVLDKEETRKFSEYLGENLNIDKINTSLNNGILYVNVEKTSCEKTSRKIEVK